MRLKIKKKIRNGKVIYFKISSLIQVLVCIPSNKKDRLKNIVAVSQGNGAENI